MSAYELQPDGTLKEVDLKRADLVAVVRCRDCKHGHKVIWPPSWNLPADWLDCHGELVETWDYYNDEEMMNPVEPDGFCAWGERK
jgi:hypothetical protein